MISVILGAPDENNCLALQQIRPPPFRKRLVRFFLNVTYWIQFRENLVIGWRSIRNQKNAVPMMAKYLSLAVALLIGVPLGGCYTDFGPVEIEARPISVASVATHLQAGDRLKVIVYGEDPLTGEYVVNPGGYVSMPLIGAIRAAGRTRSDLEREIASRYRTGGFLQDPHVTVNVAEFQPFYVLGEAEKPGEYPFRSGLNVHSAVAMAGGFTYRASRSSVLIRHVGEQVWGEYSLKEAVPIAPGDLIRIPERYF
jgi:polysaccharide export outer membrane protein